MHKQLSTTPEQLRQELAGAREHRQAACKKRFVRSRLDRHRADIELLVEAGASWRDITVWLHRYRHCDVHSTTVGRRLQQWQSEQDSVEDNPSHATPSNANNTPAVSSPPVGHQ